MKCTFIYKIVDRLCETTMFLARLPVSYLPLNSCMNNSSVEDFCIEATGLPYKWYDYICQKM